MQHFQSSLSYRAHAKSSVAKSSLTQLDMRLRNTSDVCGRHPPLPSGYNILNVKRVCVLPWHGQNAPAGVRTWNCNQDYILQQERKSGSLVVGSRRLDKLGSFRRSGSKGFISTCVPTNDYLLWNSLWYINHSWIREVLQCACGISKFDHHVKPP